VEKSYDGYTAEIIKDRPYRAIGSFLSGDGYDLGSVPYTVIGEDRVRYYEGSIVNAQRYDVTGKANATYGTVGIPEELIGYTGYYDIDVKGNIIINKAVITIKTQKDEVVAEYDEEGNLITPSLTNDEWIIIDSTLSFTGDLFNDTEGTTLGDKNGTTLYVYLNGVQTGVGSSLNTVEYVVLGGIVYEPNELYSSIKNFVINVEYGKLTIKN